MSKLSPQTCPKCGVSVPEAAPHNLCPQCLLGDVARATREDGQAHRQLTPPATEELAAAFPSLEIGELIGQGGMGFVYHARQPTLSRDVALKVLPESLAKDPAFAERFSREGRLLGKLSHPNITSIYESGQAGPFYYLLMEYIDGVNLRQAMRAAKFSPEQALRVVPSICEALQYAHDQGVLHRDIKPENILLDTQGRIKIADFGIAKMVGDAKTSSGLTVSGATMGTPHYMAPEQVESSAQIDHRADIYSLGVVFYELLTGELPIGRFEPPSQRTTMDKRLDEVVLRALEKDRERRQQSASEVKTQVETASEDASYAPSRETRSPTEEARRKAKAPAIGLAAVAGVTLLRLFASPDNEFIPTIPSMFPNNFSIPGFLLPSYLLLLTFAGFLLYAAQKLRALEHRGIALLGGQLAILSAPWTWIGLPIGVWVMLALHSPQLRNAFPRTRLQDRPETSPWPRRLFFVVVGLIIIPLILLATSLLVATLAYTKTGSTPGTTRSNQVTPTYVAKIMPTGSQKASLETGSLSLVGVARHQDNPVKWVAPNSQAAPDWEADRGDISITPASGYRAVDFLWQLDQFPSTGHVLDWSSSPPMGTSAYGTPTQDGTDAQGLRILVGEWPIETTTVDLFAHVALGDFTSIATCPGPAMSDNQYSHQAGNTGGLQWEFTFASAIQANEKAIVVLSHNLKDHEVRLVAEQQEGGPTLPAMIQRGRGNLTATFDPLDLSEVERFHAQIRPQTIIQFPKISLPDALE